MSCHFLFGHDFAVVMPFCQDVIRCFRRAFVIDCIIPRIRRGGSVQFGPQGVTSLDWASYPVARFSDTTEITPVIVQRIDQPSSGAGEEVMVAAAAAIANAFYSATGKRMTTFPLTSERVLATLAAA